MKNIVLIEDDEVTAKTVKEGLKDSGFSVLLARDGESGLELVRSEGPDLVLLDLSIPKLDGLSVLKELKKDNEVKDIPVIILSNYDSTKMVSEALENGVYSYLVKSDQDVAGVIEKVKAVLDEKKEDEES